MWKIKTRRVSRPRCPSNKLVYNTIFSLAMAIGITPKKLAKFVNMEKITKFAQDFSKELKENDKKARKKVIDKLNKK